MAVVGYFPATLAVDSNTGTRLRNAEAQVYAMTDTSFSSPLAITDVAGVPITGNKLVSNSDGIYPEFKPPAGVTQVIVKSGQALTPMTDISVSAAAAEQAAATATGAAGTATTAAGAASTSASSAATAAAQAAAVGNTNDTIIEGRIKDSTSKTAVALKSTIAATFVRNVREFGIRGDGSDETATIEAAINAFGAAGGGVLWFPHGTYKFKTLSLTAANTILQGEGDGTRLLSTYTKDDNKPAIRWIASNIGMRSLKVEAEVKFAPQAGLGSYDLLRIGGTGTNFQSGVLIDDVTFVHGGGCNAYRTRDVTIRNSRYDHSHGNSFGCVEVQDTVTITGNTATDGNDDLIAVTCDANVPGGTKRVIISNNNLFRSDAKAIATSGVASGVIIGNHCEDTYAPGIQAFTDTAFGLQGTFKVAVSNNVVIRAGKWFGASTMHPSAGTAGHGIFVSGQDISVIANKIIDTQLNGINGPSLERFKIADNEVYGAAGSAGIWLGGDPGTNAYDKLVDGDVTANRISNVAGGMSIGQGTRLSVNNNHVTGWSGAGETRAIFIGYLQDSVVNDNLLVNTLAGTYGLYLRPGSVNLQLRLFNNPVVVPGDGSFTGNVLSLTRKILFGSAAPTTGSWVQGDIVFNQNAANSGTAPFAWVCTTSGSPGTWTAMTSLNIRALDNTWSGTQTFNNLTVNGNTKLGDAATDTIGFFGAAGAVKRTVSGSRGSNAALASLIAILVENGLITDGTSA